MVNMKTNIPVSFDQQNIRYLSEAYVRGKLSHAYIIEGDAASGKEKMADYAAAALLCERNRLPDRSVPGPGTDPGSRPEGTFVLEPCGICPSCVKAFSGNHPDIIHVHHEKDTVLSVNEIREQVVADIDIKPYYGPYKIYVIRDAQLMNENAQNALLKTIEEPAEYGLILLLTDNADGFLQTIRSRCICLRMGTISRAEAAGLLLDEDGSQVMEAVRGAAGLNAIKINQTAKTFEGMDRQQVMMILQILFRDILVYKSTQQTGRLYFSDRTDMIRKLAEGLSYEGVNRLLLSVDEGRARLKASVKAEAVYENLLLLIRREFRQAGEH